MRETVGDGRRNGENGGGAVAASLSFSDLIRRWSSGSRQVGPTEQRERAGTSDAAPVSATAVDGLGLGVRGNSDKVGSVSRWPVGPRLTQPNIQFETLG